MMSTDALLSPYNESLLELAAQQAVRYDFPIVDVDAHHLDIPGRELAEYMDEPWRRRIKEMFPSHYIPHDLGERRIDRRTKRPRFFKESNQRGIDVVHPFKTAMDKLGFALCALERCGI